MKKIFILLFSIFLISCTKDKPQCCIKDNLVVFKLRDTSYINYVPVCKKGTCFPDNRYKLKVVRLHKDYFVDLCGYTMFGTNTSLIDIKAEEYAKISVSYINDSIMSDPSRKHFLTDDPLAEAYTDDNNIISRSNPDTTMLNQIIDAGEIEKYFTKAKLK